MGPKCPKCEIIGIKYIHAQESVQKSKYNSWFEIVYCNNCGHVYGVFTKQVSTMKVPLH